jgi:hypothetical protein
MLFGEVAQRLASLTSIWKFTRSNPASYIFPTSMKLVLLLARRREAFTADIIQGENPFFARSGLREQTHPPIAFKWVIKSKYVAKCRNR